MHFDKETLLTSFRTVPEIIEDYFKNIPAEYLDKKRSEQAWTIREHLYHIVSVQEMLLKRINTIKEENTPVIKPYFPENEPDRQKLFDSIEEALDIYKNFRSKQIELINELSNAELDKEAHHNEYISYNIPIIINHMIFHEYWHMYRIEELWLTRDAYFNS
ncbi:MAG: DinB family protein [Bacillota bacterium]|nr:DinB family protein [Bacillota bacterium]